MTRPNPDSSLAQLVIDRPELAAVLDSLGLDYCCEGKRSLKAAVTDANLDLERTIDLLDRTAPGDEPVDWPRLGLAELVDHIEATHHSYLREALPHLSALVDKVAAVHRDRHPELVYVRSLVADLRQDLEPHLCKEEQVLFPMIRQLAGSAIPPQFHCGTLRNPIAVMTMEHDNTADLLATVRAHTNGYRVPEDGCASYEALYVGLAKLEADIHLHVHKENNLLFPATIAADQALGTAHRAVVPGGARAGEATTSV